MDKNTTQLLSEITSKIKKLNARNARIEAENEELRKSVFGYLQQLENQKTQLEKAALSHQHELLSQSISGDKKTWLKEIDKYILMIDKCIAAVHTKL